MAAPDLVNLSGLMDDSKCFAVSQRWVSTLISAATR